MTDGGGRQPRGPCPKDASGPTALKEDPAQSGEVATEPKERRRVPKTSKRERNSTVKRRKRAAHAAPLTTGQAQAKEGQPGKPWCLKDEGRRTSTMHSTHEEHVDVDEEELEGSGSWLKGMEDISFDDDTETAREILELHSTWKSPAITRSRTLNPILEDEEDNDAVARILAENASLREVLKEEVKELKERIESLNNKLRRHEEARDDVTEHWDRHQKSTQEEIAGLKGSQLVITEEIEGMKTKLKKCETTQMRMQTTVATHNNKINSVETELQALQGSSKKADTDKETKMSKITTYVQNLAHSIEERLREQEYALSRTHQMVQEVRVRCEHLETTSAVCVTGETADHILRNGGNSTDNQTGGENKSLGTGVGLVKHTEKSSTKTQGDAITKYLQAARYEQQGPDSPAERQENQQGKEKQKETRQSRKRNVTESESGESSTRRDNHADEANVIILDPSLRGKTDSRGIRGRDRATGMKSTCNAPDPPSSADEGSNAWPLAAEKGPGQTNTVSPSVSSGQVALRGRDKADRDKAESPKPQRDPSRLRSNQRGANRIECTQNKTYKETVTHVQQENSPRTQQFNTEHRRLQTGKNCADSHTDFSDFVGIERNRLRRKRFFLGYMKKTETESLQSMILKYAQSKGVQLSFVRVMNSRQKDIAFARINVLLHQAHMVVKEDFWPKGVKCREWMSERRYKSKGDSTEDGSERNQATHLNGPGKRNGEAQKLSLENARVQL
ncbi:ELKS/Rab6-interacting/CAST family member 1-like [Branchiostoma lanceolatum]|uniref:ELKS/Rab6-interacting/CAST family member 1-like n=1 Tax=Branchiostoma lanceolatum TaxID=7740 RepID=UPI003453D36C